MTAASTNVTCLVWFLSGSHVVDNPGVLHGKELNKSINAVKAVAPDAVVQAAILTSEGSSRCGEGEDVSSVHTLLSGVVQVCHELLVGAEEEKEEEQGRQEERDVKGEGQAEENTRTWMTMWMGVKVQDSNLSQM